MLTRLASCLLLLLTLIDGGPGHTQDASEFPLEQTFGLSGSTMRQPLAS